MPYMMTEFEKRFVLSKTYDLSEMMFRDPLLGELMYKVLANFIQKTMPAHMTFTPDLHEEDMEQKKQFFVELMNQIVNIATEDQAAAKVYTTGQIATFFGVSVTTVNNWIKNGRFIGVERGDRYKQARISEHARWISTSGEWMTVAEVIAMYEKQHRQTPDTNEGEVENLRNEIAFFEKKYQGSYEATLLVKENKTVEEERDADEWDYLLRQLKRKG